MNFFHNTWGKFKRKPNRQELNTTSQNVPSVSNSNEMMPSSGSIASNAANNQTIASNETISSNVLPLSQSTQSFADNNSKSSRKRRFSYQQFKDKLRYQQLLCRHTPQAMVEKNIVLKVRENPQLIDLTSEKSFVSTTNSTQTLPQTFKTEILDHKSSVNLINRIKSQEPVTPVIVSPVTKRPLYSDILKINKQSNLFSSNQSTPKFYSFGRRIDPNAAKTPEPSENRVSIAVPESSKKFNNLLESKRDYFDSAFVSDLRKSLLESNESEDRQSKKSLSFLNVCQNKRQTDFEVLSPKLQTPITRTELSFTPFIAYDDKEEEEEEEGRRRGNGSLRFSCINTRYE